MPKPNFFFAALIFCALPVVASQLVSAATLQSSVHFESARFVDGSNITADTPAYSLSADLSFDNGVFSGLDCYVSDVNPNQGLKSGCDAYAGYFHALKNRQALSFTAIRHIYAEGFNREWDYTSLDATWHLNKKSSFSIAYANDWFDRPFDTLALKHKSRFSLSDSLSLNVAASLTAIESGAPADLISFAKVSLEYSRDRWTIEPAINLSDGELSDMFAFDVDQPDLSLTVSYRLY